MFTTEFQFLDVDSYKITHWKQYPKNTQYAMSYIEARGTEMEDVDYTIVFGLQYLLDKIKLPTYGELEETERFTNFHFDRDDLFYFDGWREVVELGYLPLKIRAVPEGTKLPVGNVIATIENTVPGFAWLISWYEIQLMRLWYPINVATISYNIHTIIEKALIESGSPETIKYRLHDFGSRGASSEESAGIAGMAHLINFVGSDTIIGQRYASMYYNSPLISKSVPASEHSTITAYGQSGEKEAYRNIIKTFSGNGNIYACVSDSYDIWNALLIWKELENEVIKCGGTLVIRPDSGDPVKTPVEVVNRLVALFGFVTNDKGYHVLPSHIRVLQGDGVDASNIAEIYEQLHRLNLSSDNISFGMGGALSQKHNRDTFRFAIKMCSITIGETDRDVYKAPIDDKAKHSKRGKLTLVKNTYGEYKTIKCSDFDNNVHKDMLQTVYENGTITRISFEEVQNNLHQ